MAFRSTKPVFYDPSHRRRRWLLALLLVLAAAMAGLLGLAAYRLTQSPQLSADAPLDQDRPSAPPKTPAEKLQTAVNEPEEFKIFAFVPQWPAQSLALVRDNLAGIQTVLPEWYRFSNTGALIDNNPEWRQRSMAVLADVKTPAAVIPVIRGTLPDLAARDTALQSMSRLSALENYAGFCLDLATPDPETRTRALALLEKWRRAAAVQRRSACAILPLGSEIAWLRAVAEAVDLVVLLGVDQRSYQARPQPLAPQEWFSASLRSALGVVDPDKLVLALGGGGLEWTSGKVEPDTITFVEAARLSGRHNVAMRFDPESLNSRLEFVDTGGQRHTIWLLDAASSYNQLLEAKAQGVSKIAFPEPASLDPAVWALMRNGSITRRDPSVAEHVSLGGYVGTEGDGPILSVTGEMRDGHRRFTAEAATGKIVAQSYDTLPQTYTVTGKGGNANNAVVLTFDDGPDDVNTPAILELLRANGVPAAFFVTGTNAQRYPDLIRRIVSDGHEIGNHFYLHSSLEDIGALRLDMEVTATQRLLAALTGRHSVYVRPPYGVEEPSTLEMSGVAGALKRLSELGYIIISSDVDPRDWEQKDHTEIARSVVNGVRDAGGSVIVLHDAGGDRSATIKALAALIPEIKAAGIRFTSLAELLGKSRDEVMPPAAPDDALIDGIGFSAMRWTGRILDMVFAVAIAMSVARTLLVILLAAVRRRHRHITSGPLPRVSVVIPAFNEEKVINNTVASVLQSSYPRLDVIVVDDGSRDGTPAAVSAAFGEDPRVRLFRQENAGKAAALNAGFALAATDVVVAIDADTVLLPDAIGHLVRHFEDPEVAAVAGNAKVGNRVNLLTRMQALEYIVAQNLDRRAFEVVNSITVVPGAIGAWRRQSVIEAGGYPTATIAEDADLTVSLLRRGHRVVYEEGAIALTEAPASLSQFVRQRFRWSFGMLQTAWRHLGALRQGRTAGWVVIPNILLFQVGLQLLAPIVDVMLAFALYDLADHVYAQRSWSIPPELQFYFTLYGAFILADLMLTVVAYLGEPSENPRLIWLSLLQRLFYRQILYWVAIRAIWAAMRGDIVSWGKLKRFATVQPPVRI